MPDPLACAYCRQHPVQSRWRPFCSERCRMADLGRWLRGDYRLPAEPDEAGAGGPEGGHAEEQD
jgi:hypothetical protein